MHRWIATFLLLLPLTAMGQSVSGALSPLAPPVAPAGNPVTPAKANLGKTLFWDEQLSSTRTVACGTCHSVDTGGADRRPFQASYYPGFHPGADGVFGSDDDVNGSLGVPLTDSAGAYVLDAVFGLGPQVTPRKSPTVIDAAYVPSLFFDGRAGGEFRDPVTGSILLATGGALENQVAGPLLNSAEMGHAGRSWNDVESRIRVSRPLALSASIPAALESWLDCRSYPDLFTEAFGTPDVTAARIAMAIATYERTLYSDQTPFDAAIAGTAPLSASEQAGHRLFVALLCAECHSSSRLTDDQFYYIGLRPAGEDPGRFAVTGDPADLGAFRTPNLRHVELRPPYMHNGQLQSLEEVVDFYDRGGDFTAPNKDPRIVPLFLSAQEKADLVAWMKRPLNDVRVLAQAPPFDRPELYTETALVPRSVQMGIAGASGSLPITTMLEPAVAGSQGFTVAVSGALGGAAAQLVIDDVELGLTPPPTPAVYSGAIVLAGVGAGSGYGSLTVAVPTTPALVGVPLFARWYVADGGTAVSDMFQFEIFLPRCTQTLCGDCDESGVSPDVLDSFTAARIAVTLIVPTGAQQVSCDVNASGDVNILDALALAQAATGLPVALACP